MKMRMVMLAGLVAAVALAAGCGSSSATGTNGGGGSANTTVRSANSSQLGTSVLVNQKGMTLYTLSAEQRRTLHLHHELEDPGRQRLVPVAVDPADGGQGQHADRRAQLGTITRPDDGATQVTWHGRPLYTFADDKAPGDASGNGFKDVGVWKAATQGASSSSSSGGGGGYGY